MTRICQARPGTRYHGAFFINVGGSQVTVTGSTSAAVCRASRAAPRWKCNAFPGTVRVPSGNSSNARSPVSNWPQSSSSV